jgi:hypothetical protein
MSLGANYGVVVWARCAVRALVTLDPVFSARDIRRRTNQYLQQVVRAPLADYPSVRGDL